MADVVENEPFGNGERSPKTVAEKAAKHMREFANERMQEFFNPLSYIPDFWLPESRQK